MPRCRLRERAATTKPDRVPSLATQALLACLEAIEGDAALRRPERLGERIAAMDRLDALPFDDGDAPIRERAATLLARLEADNQAVYRAVRRAIRRGEGGAAMRTWVHALAPSAGTPRDGHGYDALDALFAGVLPLDEPDGGGAPPPDMVFYQPTPARHILDLIDRTGLGAADTLVDLGSGLGHVPLLASICTGARGIGIERDPAYVASARRCAEALGLEHVSFIAQDARTADLSAGTLFYLYTPFRGPVLRRVLDRLRQEAAVRCIRIATLGPCTATVAEEPWLRPAEAQRADRIAVFRSRAPASLAS